MNKLNFVFWGTPDVASETLEILKENGYIPSLIITALDKPQGRKMIITPPPVKVWAMENNVPYLQPESLPEAQLRGISPKLGFGEIKPDLSIVVAYGKIIPEDIINLPKLGSINIHYSLLPKYRGASPVESAILNGDTETGITIQKMEYKMDTGPIIVQEKVEIGDDEKAGELRKRLIKIGGELLVKILNTPTFLPFTKGEVPKAEGVFKLIPQDGSKASVCKKIKKEDGEIDLNDDSIKNYNKFRAYAVWPRTFFFKDGKRIIITDAKLENGEFKILKVIPEGGKEIDYK
ncbi:MAG: methionyl-tRNA formyltransferase [Candidatus Nomurabacteria bacterium]|nr:methionyl-tRNA formyltransferase [Candidatus Nomurabacteria bacterium]